MSCDTSCMNSWNAFKSQLIHDENLGFSLDTTDIKFEEKFFDQMKPLIQKAFDEMYALEAGALSNHDEHRMVGHYWLRNSELAPTPEIRAYIETNIKRIIDFAKKVHSGKINNGQRKFKNFLSKKKNHFKNLLCIGIGGSALGPEFINNSLLNPSEDKMKLFFVDNTDPDGLDLVLQQIEPTLKNTLVLVISKSGKTPEPQNMMTEVKSFFESHGLNFSKHAVAITGEESLLYSIAKNNHWIDIFPMWDYIGGRTSVFAGVGLLPAALQGIDVKNLLAGAKAMDLLTKQNLSSNPAMRLALAWFFSTNGVGTKNMIVIPYKDRLSLFSRYLQQLIMESLGKEFDRNGNTVHQGLSVYGNKGSTDQHAYVQQLRDGLDDFFITIIDVLKDREGKAIEVEPNITSGDYLNGFAVGTARALEEKNRKVINITINKVNAFSIGMLIALYERAVGFYASMINVNAYHQPGVEAGKKAASAVLQLQKDLVKFVKSKNGNKITLKSIVDEFHDNDFRTIFKLLEHISCNNPKIIRFFNENLDEIEYSYKA